MRKMVRRMLLSILAEVVADIIDQAIKSEEVRKIAERNGISDETADKLLEALGSAILEAVEKNVR